MDALMDLNYTTMQLRQINACRMYLQITMLAEMTDHTGTILLPQVVNATPNQTPQGLDTISHSLLDWPTVHNPSTQCWKLWTRTIQTVFTGSPKGTRLHQPLGAWLGTHSNHRFWQWRYALSGCLLYSSNLTQSPRATIQTTMTR